MTEQQPDPEARAVQEPETGAVPDPETQAVQDPEPGPESEAIPDPETEAVQEPEAEAVPEPDPMDVLRDRIEAPDQEPEHVAAQLQATLMPPVGSLGRLEQVAAWFATAQGQSPPRDFQRARAVLFAADHGVAAAGISTYPAGSTAKLVAAVRAGTAPVNVLADIAGATLRLVDVGVDSDEPSADRIRRSSGRIDRENALTPEQAQAAIDVGVRIADEEVDAGADLLIIGDVGVANTAAAAVLIAVCLGSEPTAVTGRGSGIDDAAWMRKVVVVRDALRRGRTHRYEAVDLLAASGGADLAAMTGFLLEAAARKTPVLLDGVVSAAAALVARDTAFDAPSWWFATHRTEEPAHVAALESLGMQPLLDLGIQLGQGTGGLIALPLIRAAVRTLSEVATRQSIGLSTEGQQ